MLRNRATTLLITTGAVGALVLVGAAPAQASSTRTSSTTQSAYSWNDYRTPVSPAGFVIPRGYVKVSAAVTVKRGSTTIASNRSVVSVGAGTYTAYSTFRYRSRTAYVAHRTVAVTYLEPDSCVVDTVVPTDTSVEYSLTCTGTGWDPDYNDIVGTAQTDVTQETAIQFPWWSAGQTITSADENWDAVDLFLDGTASQRYTAYRYGPVLTKAVHRTVTVKKVVNTSVMTRTEWNVLESGDSLSWVQHVVGSRGTMFYDDGGSFLGTAYRWKNTSGSYTCIWFDGSGHATDFYWYG
ncbi:MAG: hypothetical protein U0R68_10785 [Candidatus Nanopelagicales bacterium]